MNIIERQTTLGKSLFEINSRTFASLANLQRENIEKYFETNRDFGSRLTDIKDAAGFVSVQSQYGETLWNNVRDNLEAQSGIVRSAFEESRDAIQLAFGNGEEVAQDKAAQDKVVEDKPVKARPKAKARKSAKTGT